MRVIALSQEAQRLARRLAEARHVPVDTAIKEALEASAVTLLKPDRPRVRSPEAVAARRACVDRIVAEIAAMPALDHRSPQEIIDDLSDVRSSSIAPL